jgi:protein-tyrosine phosphatase
VGFKNFSFITDRLATGGAPEKVEDMADLFAVGITHVIDLRVADDPSFKGMVAVLHNPTEDDGKPKPPEWFHRSGAFAMAVLANPRGRVYVHCDQGINRGPSTAYFILRVWTGMFARDARILIEAHRPRTILGIRYAYYADAAIGGI